MSEAKEPAKSGKSKKGLLFAVVGVVVLVGAGAGGYVFWSKSQGESGHESKAAKAEEAKEPEVSGALPFEPFIVNLADKDASRYLKTSIRLLVAGEENMKELEENKVVMARLRSAILEDLSQQTSDHLVTPEGKEELKKSIAERCTKVLGEDKKVADVLFAEFVVQF